VTAIGLQARVDPALLYMKELVAEGYVGEVLAVRVGLLREGVLTRPSHRTWQRDASLGANTLTIANGHTIDAMRFVCGEFRHLSAVVTTQARQWLDTGTNTWLDVTSPDNILLSGGLANGAVLSSHVGAIPYAGSGYRMEVYGRDGTLIAAGEDSPQLSKVFLSGAQRGNALEPLAVPERFTFACSGTPDGEPFNVGQMYALFARTIRGGESVHPDFATALDLHRLIDAIRSSAATGRAVAFG
jgi:predicted dehydrogenase